jgi:hypothetical protein
MGGLGLGIGHFEAECHVYIIGTRKGGSGGK